MRRYQQTFSTYSRAFKSSSISLWQEKHKKNKILSKQTPPLQTVNLQQSQDFIENVFKDKVEDHALYSKITDIFTEVRKQVPDNLVKDLGLFSSSGIGVGKSST